MENTNEKYIEDLKDIRDMMERSSRFISLSGLSGVIAGIVTMIGAWLAYQTVYAGQDYFNYRQVDLTTGIILKLVGIAVLVILISFVSAVFLTTRKAKKNNQKIWDVQTKRLLLNLMIPLATGGILCLIFLSKGYIGILAPLTLIFYGLALVNASKYTLTEIRSLGLGQILLGLIASYFIGYGLLFWVIGFGALHIVYGLIMQVKYGS